MSGLVDSVNTTGFFNPIVQIWDNTTPVGSAIVMNTAGYDTVAVTVSSAGTTVTGGQIQFSVFDGYAYIPLKSPRISSYATDSQYNLNGTQAGVQGWSVPCAGFPNVRIQLTVPISGTAPQVLITAVVSASPDVSVVTAGIDPASLLPAYAASTTPNNLLMFRMFCPAATTVQSVKSYSGKIHTIRCNNLVATARYLKIWDASSPGSVTVGSTTPLYTFQIPASGSLIHQDLFGIRCTSGIQAAIVAGTGLDTDTAAPAASDVLTQIDYV